MHKLASMHATCLRPSRRGHPSLHMAQVGPAHHIWKRRGTCIHYM